MCFVLDVNAFPAFFGRSLSLDFVPLRDWLFDDAGTTLVVGGTKYATELGKLSRYLGYLAELERSRKLFRVDDATVDAEASRVKAMVADADFDDEHLVGLFCASGCQLFASQDKRADRYVKDKSLYPKGQKPPRIYRSARHHSGLLAKSSIVALRNPATAARS